MSFSELPYQEKELRKRYGIKPVPENLQESLEEDERERQKRLILHPSKGDLTLLQANAMRLFERKYDQTMNVTVEDLKKRGVDEKTINELFGLGFIKEQNGRLIPTWVFQEHKDKTFHL
jgi:hypothetical protein